MTRIKVRPLTIALIVLAIVFVILAIVYFTTNAGKLPSILPGHEAGSLHKHTKHGIAMLGLAALSLVGAWFTTAPADQRS